jgi:hypothetical protein
VDETRSDIKPLAVKYGGALWAIKEACREIIMEVSAAIDKRRFENGHIFRKKGEFVS